MNHWPAWICKLLENQLLNWNPNTGSWLWVKTLVPGWTPKKPLKDYNGVVILPKVYLRGGLKKLSGPTQLINLTKQRRAQSLKPPSEHPCNSGRMFDQWWWTKASYRCIQQRSTWKSSVKNDLRIFLGWVRHRFADSFLISILHLCWLSKMKNTCFDVVF